MKTPASVALLSLIACACFAADAEAPPAEADPLAELVRGLSSESFREREDATRALWDEGDAALEALREASVSRDPETAKRASEVLEKVELRITPETAPEIIDHIRRYRTAPQNLKANHINELRKRKAYFQLLKLYSMEDKPEAKAALAGSIRGVAMQGAREAIAADDFATAEQFLRMSAKDPNDLIALAWVYRCMGKLEDGMENPPKPEGVSTENWKIALLRVKGDLPGAIREAVDARQPRLFAALKVLDGDPTLWIRQNGDGRRGAQALDAYVDIALKRWEGKVVNDADFAPLLDILKERDSEDQAQALASLASLGRMAEAERHQAKEEPATGFLHYLAQERIGEALETLGLDPVKPDYTKWVAGRFAKLMDDDDERDDGVGSPRIELLLIAGFLETRGLAKELEDAYSGPLGKYAERQPENFLEFIRMLFQPISGASRFAAAHAAAWAGDEDNRWRDVFSAAFGGEEVVGEWLAWIVAIEPDAGKPEILRGMMALFGMGSDPDGLAEKWLAKAWEAANGSAEGDREKHLRRIRMLAVARQDVATALKVRDTLGAESRKSEMWPFIEKYMTAAGRWEEAAEILGEKGDVRKTSPEFHAEMATMLRRAGQGERAAEHDAMAEKLSLGYSPSCTRIGDMYLYGGEMERAAEWYRRAAMHADVSSGDFTAALESYARSMFEAGRWGIAASCYEALVQNEASEQLSGRSLSTYPRMRLNADLSKALAVLPDDRNRAIAMLEGIHRNFPADGLLADDFFPMLREVGLMKEMEKWFGESWDRITAVIARFPECDNTRNTAAWLASRARMKVPEAEEHLRKALAKNPGQAAYLDTMAEVRFAMGDREGAVKWSDLSLLRYPLIDPHLGVSYDTMIRRQNHRFHNDPLPR